MQAGCKKSGERLRWRVEEVSAMAGGDVSRLESAAWSGNSAGDRGPSTALRSAQDDTLPPYPAFCKTLKTNGVENLSPQKFDSTGVRGRYLRTKHLLVRWLVSQFSSGPISILSVWDGETISGAEVLFALDGWGWRESGLVEGLTGLCSGGVLSQVNAQRTGVNLGHPCLLLQALLLPSFFFLLLRP